MKVRCNVWGATHFLRFISDATIAASCFYYGTRERIPVWAKDGASDYRCLGYNDHLDIDILCLIRQLPVFDKQALGATAIICTSTFSPWMSGYSGLIMPLGEGSLF